MEDIILSRKKTNNAYSKTTINTNTPTTDINAMIFEADTSKYLNTQKLIHIEKEHHKFTDIVKRNNLSSWSTAGSYNTSLATSNDFSQLNNMPIVLNETTFLPLDFSSIEQ